jgi:hypothetical protein
MLLGVVSLMAESTTGVLMSPGYGGYQTATPPSPTQQPHTQQPVTTPPRLESITPQLLMPRAATPKPRSITLP